MGKYEKKEPFLKKNIRTVRRWLGYLLFLFVGFAATKLLGLEALLEKIPDDLEADVLYCAGLIAFLLIGGILSTLKRKRNPGSHRTAQKN